MHILRPTLDTMQAYTPDAEELLMRTAMQESNFEYVRQLGDGPALGLFQMEPEMTGHKDAWVNYLRYPSKQALRARIARASGLHRKQVLADRSQLAEAEARGIASNLRLLLIYNLAYQVCMARVKYLRDSWPIPPARDVEAQGAYWKRVYNTHLGHGTVDQFVHSASLLDG